MRIGFINLDWSNIRDADGHPTPGGAGWYRMALPVEYLRRNGVDVVLGTRVMFRMQKGVFVTVDHDGNELDDLDVVVLQRWMDNIAPEAIARARSNGQVVINDVDDFFDGIHPANRAWEQTHPRMNPRSNRDHYRRALAASSGIITSTPFLQYKMQEINRGPVVLVRNAIDLERWTPRDVSGEITLGWVGVTSYRSEDLQVVTHPVAEFLRSHPKSYFHHGGNIPGQSPTVPELFGASGDQARTSDMTSILDYPRLFDFSIGVIPLNDIPFNHAKSAIKGIECAASGIPFVASATPEYEWLRQQGIGCVARKPKHWRPALEALADPVRRQQLGDAYRCRVREFDFARQWRNWLTAIQEIAR